MTKKRKARSAKFKLKVALEAIEGQKTLNQIASEYQINPGQVSQWKRQLQSQGEHIFKKGTEQIGRLKMELEWLKKRV